MRIHSDHHHHRLRLGVSLASFAILAAGGCTQRETRIESPTPIAVPPPSPTGTRPERVIELGRSVEQRPIRLHSFGNGGDAILVFGGFHGDEPAGAAVARELIALLRSHPGLSDGRRIAIVPEVNPDGLMANRRTNARGVDINRNLPASNWLAARSGNRALHGTAAASEPETRAVLEAIRIVRPVRILTIHCIRRGGACVNYDGPASALARAMAAVNGYPVRPTMGYETHGSLGSWAGVDRQIPTVTLELPANTPPDRCWAANREAILAFIRGAGKRSPGG